MQALTTTNKKQIKCPSCGQTITWNTSEQKTIMGNRVITCSQCGANLIVPRTELQPYFNKYPISYTDNIYGDSSDSESSSNLYSEATVTLKRIGSYGKPRDLIGIFIDNGILVTYEYYPSGSNDETIYTIVLYDGEGRFYCSSFGTTPVLSGSIEYSDLDEAYIVTGDCTITLDYSSDGGDEGSSAL